MNTSEGQTCSGKDADSEPCACHHHAPNPQQRPDEVQCCKNCGHWDTCHPAQTTSKLESILTRYCTPASRVQAGGLKNTLEDTVKETNLGLCLGQHGELKIGNVQARSKKAAKKPISTLQPDDKATFKIAHLIMIPVGLIADSDTLQRTTAPTNTEISTTYLNYGLATIQDKGEGIVFKTGWTAKQFDELFRRRLLQAMNYLDLSKRAPKAATDDYHWYILSKLKGGKLSVALWSCGITIDSCVKDFVVGQGKSWKEKALYLASICHIPPDVYKNDWVVPEDISNADQGSDANCETMQTLPREATHKRAHSTISILSGSDEASDASTPIKAKGKGKQRAFKERKSKNKWSNTPTRKYPVIIPYPTSVAEYATLSAEKYKGCTPLLSPSGIDTLFDYPIFNNNLPDGFQFPTMLSELVAYADSQRLAMQDTNRAGPSSVGHTSITYSLKGRRGMGLEFSDNLEVEDPWKE